MFAAVLWSCLLREAQVRLLALLRAVAPDLAVLEESYSSPSHEHVDQEPLHELALRGRDQHRLLAPIRSKPPSSSSAIRIGDYDSRIWLLALSRTICTALRWRRGFILCEQSIVWLVTLLLGQRCEVPRHTYRLERMASFSDPTRTDAPRR
jgi:hypothetical protein